MNIFLLLHIPILFLIIYGLKEVIEMSFIGLIISVVLCFSGFFAFFFHMYFIRKGRIEFNAPISIGMIVGIFIFINYSIDDYILDNNCLKTSIRLEVIFLLR